MCPFDEPVLFELVRANSDFFFAEARLRRCSIRNPLTPPRTPSARMSIPW